MVKMWWHIFISLVCAVICVHLFRSYFHRDPEREVPRIKNGILSPADGWIREIREIRKGEIPYVTKSRRKIRLDEVRTLNILENFDEAYLVGIYMSPFDVHVNRSPIDGVVKFVNYIRGKKYPLIGSFKNKNERNMILIANDVIKVAVIQIASHFARRIECFIQEGQKLLAGERIGIIKLSSQVDIIIPKIDGLKLIVRKGSRVKAGVSLIAVIDDGIEIPETGN